MIQKWIIESYNQLKDKQLIFRTNHWFNWKLHANCFWKIRSLFLLSAELPCLKKNNFDHKFAWKALKTLQSHISFWRHSRSIVDKRKGDLNIVNLLSDNSSEKNYSEQESTQLSIKKVHTEIIFIICFSILFKLSIKFYQYLFVNRHKVIKHKLYEWNCCGR